MSAAALHARAGRARDARVRVDLQRLPLGHRADADGRESSITSALTNLDGIYFTNNNLITAGAVLVALPALLVFAALQRQFVSGLTPGASMR